MGEHAARQTRSFGSFMCLRAIPAILEGSYPSNASNYRATDSTSRAVAQKGAQELTIFDEHSEPDAPAIPSSEPSVPRARCA
jgi:hypothetical protein